MDHARLTILVLLTTCLALAGCPTGKPGDNGEVEPGTGGRDGNSIRLFSQDIRLFYDDESLPPTQRVDIEHEGARITIAQPDGSPMPTWLAASPILKEGTYFSSTVLTYQPQSDAPHIDQVTLRFSVSDADGSNVIYTDARVVAVVEHRLSRSREFLNHTVGAPNPTTRLELTADGLWNASPYERWTKLSALTGRGNASIDIDVAADSLPVGDHIGVTPFDVPAAQRVKTYRLYLGVDPRRLETDQRGLAFSSTLGASRLHRELRVIDTAGLAGRWALSDDAPWLSASANDGMGSGGVTFSADPAGLADGIHYATVTLAPDNEPGLGNTTAVRVGFHIDHTSPANTSVDLVGNVPTGVLAADPIRPWLYSIDRDGSNATLRVWNFATGAQVDSLALGDVTAARARVSQDGSLLLISDVAHGRFVPIQLDASTRTVAAPWTGMKFTAGAEDFAFARLNGVDAVAWSAGQLLSAQNGAVLATFDYFPTSLGATPPSIAVANDGRYGCMVVSEGNTARLHYLAMGNRAGKFSAALADPAVLPDAGGDCLLDSAGANVYVAVNGGVLRFPFQARRLELDRAASSLGKLQRLANGEVFWSGSTQWMHLSAGLDDLGSSSAAPAQLQGLISGDETRVFERLTDGSQVSARFRDRDF